MLAPEPHSFRDGSCQLRMSKDWNEVIPDDMRCGVAFNEMVYDIETFMFDRDEDAE